MESRPSTHADERFGMDRNLSPERMGVIAPAPNARGGGSGYHYPNEECNGMLRIWDGPLREVPACNDLNW